MNSQPVRLSKFQREQAMLNGMKFGPTTKLKDGDYRRAPIKVPDLTKDIMPVTDLRTTIARYEGLYKTISSMLSIIKKSRKPNMMCKMTVDELTQLRQQELDLEDALQECLRQLSRARDLHSQNIEKSSSTDELDAYLPELSIIDL